MMCNTKFNCNCKIVHSRCYKKTIISQEIYFMPGLHVWIILMLLSLLPLTATGVVEGGITPINTGNII